MKRLEIRVWGSLFLSGFAALLLEVVWIRLFVLVFGTTTQASTAVFATFMGGLALGNLLVERRLFRIQRPFRLYAVAEGITAFIALAAGISYSRFGLSPTLPPALLIGAMIVPTFCMGVTVPLVISGLERRGENPDRASSWAYGFNTLGGAAGALGASFLILPQLGLAGTQVLAAGVLVLAGFNVFNFDEKPATISSQEGGTPILPGWKWTILSAWAGAGALSLEIVWTRLLSLILGPSVYALGVVLFVYLLAIALGAAMVPKLLQRWNASRLVMMSFLFLAGSIGWSLISFSFLPYLFVESVSRFSLRSDQLHWAEFFLSMLAIAPTALLHGILLPALISALSIEHSRGETAARLLGANTVGAILGTLLTGLVAIPAVGFLPILTFILGGNLLVGLFLFLPASEIGSIQQRRIVSVSLLAFAFFFSWRSREFWDRSVLASGVYKYAVGDALQGKTAKIDVGEVLFYREGISSTVAVIKTVNDRILSVDGKADASAAGDRSTQVLLAALPLSLSEKADRALVIGFASGVTAGVASLFPNVEVTAVEIEPAVYEASNYFLDVNHGPLSAPHREVIADARHFLSRTLETFDVITSEPSNPWMSGVAPLFTRDFFAIARDRLRPGGVMCQWLPIYGMTKDLVNSVVATFHDVFPEILIFESVEGYDLLLIGSLHPIPLQMSEIEKRWKRSELVEELSQIGIVRGVDMAGRFLMGKEGARKITLKSVINRDGNGFLEFQAPKALHLRTAEDNHTYLVMASEGILPYLAEAARGEKTHDELAERFFRRGDTRLVKLVSP